MAFNSFMGDMGDYDFSSEDLVDPPAPDPQKARLDALQKQNEENSRIARQSQLEAARQLGELNAKVDMMLRQPKAEIKNSTDADNFVANFWAGNSQDQSQQQNTQQQKPVGDVVRQTLSDMAGEQARLKAEENTLAARFQSENPDLVRTQKQKQEAHYEWKRLEALRPDLPQTQRYEIMVGEMRRRFASAPAASSNSNADYGDVNMDGTPTYIPTEHMTENLHPEVAQEIGRRPLSAKQRIHNKAKDTFKRVDSFKKDRSSRTSVSNYEVNSKLY